MGDEFLTVNIVEKTYRLGDRDVVVLKDLVFSISAGDVLAILGPSGCGKTTLLRLLCGLDDDYQGYVQIGGKAANAHLKRFGIVFQEDRLLEWRTVSQNIAFGIDRGTRVAERQMQVASILHEIGLDTYGHTWPYQLSGGMRKRVALGRALVSSPDVLLLDEPFSGLDLTSKMYLQDLFAKLIQNRKPTTILVTHDVDDALALGDMVAILSDKPSKIVELINIAKPERENRLSEPYACQRRELLAKCLDAWQDRR